MFSKVLFEMIINNDNTNNIILLYKSVKGFGGTFKESVSRLDTIKGKFFSKDAD